MLVMANDHQLSHAGPVMSTAKGELKRPGGAGWSESLLLGRKSLCLQLQTKSAMASSFEAAVSGHREPASQGRIEPARQIL
jgi:hypothetical protein